MIMKVLQSIKKRLPVTLPITVYMFLVLILLPTQNLVSWNWLLCDQGTIFYNHDCSFIIPLFSRWYSLFLWLLMFLVADFIWYLIDKATQCLPSKARAFVLIVIVIIANLLLSLLMMNLGFPGLIEHSPLLKVFFR